MTMLFGASARRSIGKRRTARLDEKVDAIRLELFGGERMLNPLRTLCRLHG